MYYLCEKYYKPITVQHRIADCAGQVPRLILLDLRTNWTYKLALGMELVRMWGTYCIGKLGCRVPFGFHVRLWFPIPLPQTELPYQLWAEHGVWDFFLILVVKDCGLHLYTGSSKWEQASAGQARRAFFAPAVPSKVSPSRRLERREQATSPMLPWVTTSVVKSSSFYTSKKKWVSIFIFCGLAEIFTYIILMLSMWQTMLTFDQIIFPSPNLLEHCSVAEHCQRQYVCPHFPRDIM